MKDLKKVALSNMVSKLKKIRLIELIHHNNLELRYKTF
jgi:hypothetical protein